MHTHVTFSWRAFVKPLLAAAGLAMIMPSNASAQDLLKRVKNAVQSEVERQVEQEARDAARCALNGSNCRPNGTGQQSASGGGEGGGGGGGKGDHPLITPYQGSVLEREDRQDFTDYNRVIGMDQKRQAVVQRVEGRLTKLLYRNPEGRSTLELERNYKSALAARGFRIDYDKGGIVHWMGDIRKYNGMTAYGQDVRYFTGKLKYNNGTAYVSILVYREGSGFGRTNIHVLETADMDVGMVGVDPSAMAADLERDGQINLQGIYFDTGNYALKPESDPALDNVEALLRLQPQLRLTIIGHTDSTGDTRRNRRLSLDRATSVRNSLISRGVAPDRLSVVGMGSEQPIATNSTADGRANNRRVMLVRK
ncbi:MAG: OmpA family protein [Allopontixanthobacter sediminis]